MSLPDAPNTLREKYYSVMAGQNDADILPDIETAPSTENRYLDYIAKHGGGGGGDVSGVKGDAEETYRTGNVNITAANVGAYTKTETDTLLNSKADKAASATAGNFAGLDSNGNLIDSGKKPSDFATPSNVAAEEISSTSTTSPLTDSADGMVQGLTIYGRSEVVEGEIKSVGDNGLTVQTTGKNLVEETISGANVDPTGKLTLHPNYDAHIAKVIENHTYTITTDEAEKVIAFYTNKPVLTDKSYNQSRILQYSNTIIAPINGYIVFRSSAGYVTSQIEEGTTATAYEPYRSTSADYTTGLPLRSADENTYDELDFAAGTVTTRCYYDSSDNEVKPLVTPTVIPLTDAEISAFRALRTFDGTTHITVTDDPEMTVDYLKNTENGQAVADIQKDLQGQINGLAIKTLTYTGTGNRTNAITFPIKPMQVLGITQHEMESPYQDYHRSIIPFVYDSRSSTMLCQWVKNVDTSSTQYRGSMLYYLTINGNTMTWTAQDASQAFNLENIEYTVYYI